MDYHSALIGEKQAAAFSNAPFLTCELVVIVSTLATNMVFPLRRTMPVHQPMMYDEFIRASRR